MTSPAPPAMVPAHVNLRPFAYMPLQVARLRDSDFAATATGDGFRCALLLWCACWHQIPAGSLPDDDRVLAKMVGLARTPRLWKKYRTEALYGFVKCDDGRFYHPVISAEAMKAWGAHLTERYRNECGRLKKAAQRAGIAVSYPSFAAWKQHYETTGQAVWVAPNVPGTGGSGPGSVPGESGSKGREEKRRDNVAVDTSTSAEVSKRAEVLARALESMGWESCAKGHPQIQRAAEQGITVDEIKAAATGNEGKALKYVVSTAIGRRDDAAQQGTSSPGATIPTPPDPSAMRAREIDDEIRMVHSDFRLELFGQEERDRKLTRLQAELSGLAASMEAAR